MYLFSIPYFIRQILPPHWRDTYRERMLGVLLAPVQRIYGEFTKFRKDLKKDINLNAQVGVLEAYLNRKYAVVYSKHIEITDDTLPASVKILIATKYMALKPSIQADVWRFLPIGVKVIYQEKTTQ